MTFDGHLFRQVPKTIVVLLLGNCAPFEKQVQRFALFQVQTIVLIIIGKSFPFSLCHCLTHHHE